MGFFTKRTTVIAIAKGSVVVGLVVIGMIANFQTHQVLDYIQACLRPLVALVGAGPTTITSTPLAFRDFRPWPATGPHHKRLAMVLELPPLGPISIEETPEAQVADAKIDLHQSVVGIIFEGKAVAVPLAALSGPTSHIAILDFGDTQMALTHCNLSNCTRVLQLPETMAQDGGESDVPLVEASTLIDLMVGGLDIDGGLVLLYDDIRYSQRSQELPLDDCEFELTDLSTWRELHPETTVVYPTP